MKMWMIHPPMHAVVDQASWSIFSHSMCFNMEIPILPYDHPLNLLLHLFKVLLFLSQQIGEVQAPLLIHPVWEWWCIYIISKDIGEWYSGLPEFSVARRASWPQCWTTRSRFSRLVVLTNQDSREIPFDFYFLFLTSLWAKCISEIPSFFPYKKECISEMMIGFQFDRVSRENRKQWYFEWITV